MLLKYILDLKNKGEGVFYKEEIYLRYSGWWKICKMYIPTKILYFPTKCKKNILRDVLEHKMNFKIKQQGIVQEIEFWCD